VHQERSAAQNAPNTDVPKGSQKRMEQIPEKIVEETWEEVAQFDQAKIEKEMEKLSKEQADLLAFVFEFTKGMDQSVAELAIYLYFTIYRMFRKAQGKKINAIPANEIMERYESHESLLETLEEQEDLSLEQTASAMIAVQPHVMEYLTETIFDADEDEDLPEISDEDKGTLFLVLTTMVDLLNRATN
jgi:hypothetical protein